MRFYAYLWLREDGTPYYVGKGFGNRAFISHRRGVLSPPVDQTRILICWRARETEAFEPEKELIANWGRKDLGTGCLRNLDEGGQGKSGYRHTLCSRTKMAQARMGHPSYITLDGVAKMRATKKARGSLIGNQNAKGTKRSEEWKAAFRVRMKEIWANDPVRRERTRQQMLGNNHAAGQKLTVPT